MAYNLESGHGLAEELTVEPAQRPLRPLTTAEKLEATNVVIDSRDSTSTRAEQFELAPAERELGFLGRLDGIEATLNRRLGVESHAIDRKLPEERQQQSCYAQLSIIFLWTSATMTLPSFATGFLGWKLGLDLQQSILICIFGSILGGAVSGFCATLGAATGLRQISVSRYSMGWYPNKLIALLNTLQQLASSAVGCITGGLALTAVANGRLSITVGIIIVAVCALCISFLGLRFILLYERYAWLPYFVIFLIILGETGQFVDTSETFSLGETTLSGNVLTFLAIVYGFSARWTTVASDYYVQYPADISRTKVFVLTSLAIAIPTSIAMVAGCVVGSSLNNRPDWLGIYEYHGLGFLIRAVLYPRGFADFLLVLLALSGVNMIIINTYSAAISCQQFARPLARVPRFVWTIACFCVTIILSLAGRHEMLKYMQNFLGLLGYWCTSYFVIVISEHYLFRKGAFYNYDLEGWNDPAAMPVGLAAGAAFGLGVVTWVMGMVQTWYTGPLGAQIGHDGGDVANELTLFVTAIAYVPLRYLELRKIGR